jgi:uncharacterized protein
MPPTVLRRPAPGGADTDPGSPCNSVCRISPDTGWCEGCLRTLDEIVAWGAMAPRERRQAWAELARREASLGSGLPGVTLRAGPDTGRADT